jgi:hypothetical protein
MLVEVKSMSPAGVLTVRLPVTSNDPVINADPVNGNGVPPDPVLIVIGKVVLSPLVNVIVFKLTEAVVTNEPVSTVVPPPFKAKDAVKA